MQGVLLMRQIIFGIILLLAFIMVASAQETKQKELPAETVRPSAEQQKQFAELVEQVEKAKAEAETAAARFEAAQARSTALLYQIMALLKLSPAEYRPILKEGVLTFERIQAPPSASPK